MANITFKGNPVTTVGDLPAVGEAAPDFTLVKDDMSEVSLSDYRGSTLILSIFPSLDTGTCAASVRRFNQEATDLDDNVKVLNVSMDLPFAHARFCAAEGIDAAENASAFRSSFGDDYGVRIADSGMAGLLTRTVIVIDPEGVVRYVQLVPEIADEPQYEEVLENVK